MDEKQPPLPDRAWMRAAAKANPVPEWTGDLFDDCTAHWAGFILRAEKMDDRVWWWAVSLETGVEIASANDKGIYPEGGRKAQATALHAAHCYLQSNPSLGEWRHFAKEWTDPWPGTGTHAVLDELRAPVALPPGSADHQDGV